MHPRGLRCSSLKYSRYSRSSRLAREAPRPSRCDATLSPRAGKLVEMAVDRQRLGLTLLRVCIGVFFIFEGLGKIGWFTNTAILSGTFSEWARSAAPESISAWYLHRIAVPGVALFARLVPLGELSAGIALVAGVWPRPFPLVAFIMA